MKIKITTRVDPSSTEVVELLDLVERKCNGSDYGRGELESLRAEVDNQTKFLAFLLEQVNPSDEVLTEFLCDWDEKLEKVEDKEC